MTEIRDRRKALFLTQMELATAAGVSLDSIQQMEKGARTNFRASNIARVRDALDRLEAARSRPVRPSNGRPADQGELVAIPQRHGLYFVPSDMKAAYLLTSADGVPDLPPLERVVLVAVLKYVLNEYEDGQP